MALDDDYPLSLFRDAIRSILGWTAAMVVVICVAALIGTLANVGIGTLASAAEFPSLGRALGALFLLALLSFFHPATFLVMVATAIIWYGYIMFDVESCLARAVGLGVVFVMWLAVAYWLGELALVFAG